MELQRNTEDDKSINRLVTMERYLESTIQKMKIELQGCKIDRTMDILESNVVTFSYCSKDRLVN
jgi:hypothetical protein